MSEIRDARQPSPPTAGKLDDSLPVEIRGTKQQLSELLARWQRQARGLLAVNHIARVVVSSQSLEEILAAAVDEIEDSLGVGRAQVILLDRNTGQLSYHGIGGQKSAPPALEEGQALEAVVKRVIESGDSMRFDQSVGTDAGLAFASQACTTLCVPLQACDHIVGAIEVTNKLQHRIAGKPRPFDEQDQEVLEGVAAFVAMAVENARLQEATRTEAAVQTLRETVVTLAHYVNNPLQGTVSAAELLKEQLERLLPAGCLAPADGTTALSLVDVIIENAEEIKAVLRLLQDVGLPESTTYVGNQQMLDIEKELQARIEATQA